MGLFVAIASASSSARVLGVPAGDDLFDATQPVELLGRQQFAEVEHPASLRRAQQAHRLRRTSEHPDVDLREPEGRVFSRDHEIADTDEAEAHADRGVLDRRDHRDDTVVDRRLRLPPFPRGVEQGTNVTRVLRGRRLPFLEIDARGRTRARPSLRG